MSGQLVEQWPKKKLKDIVVRLTNGYVGATRGIYQESGIPYLLARHVRDNKLNFDERTFITEEFNQKIKKSILKYGDVLLVQSGHIGHSAVVPEKHSGHNCHAMIVITPVENILLGSFLSHYFQSPFMRKKFQEIRTGSTVPHLTCRAVKELEIPVPPLEEQQRIVSILDEVFENIQNETVQIENKLLSTKGLFQSKLESIFNARDDNWGDFTFDEIIQSKLIGLVRNNKSQSDEYPYRYVKMNNIGNDNSFNEANIVNVQATPSEVEKFSLRNGDFLFNTRNSYELVGKICIFQSEAVAPTLFNNNIMRVRFTSEINPSFIALAFSCKDVVDQLEKMKSGTTNVVGIYYKSLRKLRINIPSLSEQNAIVDSLGLLISKTQSLKEIYQSNLDSYSKLKQSILQEAFNGTLRIAEGLADQS